MPSRPNPIQGRARLDTFTKLPGGWLSYATRTTNYVWTTTLTSIIETTFSLPTDRLLKVSIWSHLQTNNTGYFRCYSRIALTKDLGGSVFKEQYHDIDNTSGTLRWAIHDSMVIDRPADRLYTARWEVDSLLGSPPTTLALSNAPTILLVEDIGPPP